MTEGRKADRRSERKPGPHLTSRSVFTVAAGQLSELMGGKDTLESQLMCKGEYQVTLLQVQDVRWEILGTTLTEPGSEICFDK